MARSLQSLGGLGCAKVNGVVRRTCGSSMRSESAASSGRPKPLSLAAAAAFERYNWAELLFWNCPVTDIRLAEFKLLS